MKRIFCLLTIFFCTLFAFNASAQEERDSPRRGEGISVFLERNKRPGRAYYKEFLELNKKRLKGKEELRLGSEVCTATIAEWRKLRGWRKRRCDRQFCLQTGR